MSLGSRFDIDGVQLGRWMLLVALCLFIPQAFAAGLGIKDRGRVDGIDVDPASGLVTLVLVIDRPLEDGLTKHSARRKVLGYRMWVDDPRFASSFPKARPDLGVRLVIAHFPAKNALGRSILEQLEGYARELRFVARTQVLEPDAVSK